QRPAYEQNRDAQFSRQPGNIGWNRNLQSQTDAYSRNQQQQGDQRGYGQGYNSGYVQSSMGYTQGYSQNNRGYQQGSNNQSSWGYGQGNSGYGQGNSGYAQGGSYQSQQSYGQIPAYNTAQGQTPGLGGNRDNRGYGNQSSARGTEIPPPPFYKSNRR
ncbi:hypothetical protein ACJMK2_036875, partial [Sinanodonta woodiana]